MTWIMVIGFLFFFSTRIWNEDDRPRMNSWVQRDTQNVDGNLRIHNAIYVEDAHELNLLIHETTFVGSGEGLNVHFQVVNRDGSYYNPDVKVIHYTIEMNHTRSLIVVDLDDESLEWYYVRVALIDRDENQNIGLTMDWRLVERNDERLVINEINDFFFEEKYDESSMENFPNKNGSQVDLGYYTDLVISEREEILQGGGGHHHHYEHEYHDREAELETLREQLARLQSIYEDQPYHPIIGESIEYYRERIEILEYMISQTSEKSED